MIDSRDWSRVRTALVTAVGLAHFAVPGAFEPLIRWLGSTRNSRRRVYVAGAVETAIGVLSATNRTRPLSMSLGVGYLFLTGCALLTRSAAKQVTR